MPKLKVFRYSAHSPSVAHALGQPAHRLQVEAIIATTSQVKAAEAFGVTIGAFRNYGGETRNVASCEVALKHPGVVIYSALDSHGGPWIFADGQPA